MVSTPLSLQSDTNVMETLTSKFFSYFLSPGASVFEDPVTGSAHCSLVPYWSARLGKKTLLAKQVSSRTGILRCKDLGDKVSVAGEVVTYLQGSICLC